MSSARSHPGPDGHHEPLAGHSQRREESAVSRQRCERCGREYPELATVATCECGGLLELFHDVRADAMSLRRLFAERVTLSADWRGSGVWRYRELVLPTIPDPHIVTQREGSTPVRSSSQVSEWAGVELRLKHEGANPTGSFKDRGMTVAVSHAKRLGATTVACASTGNTSASLASYASQAGIASLVFVPEGQVSIGKMSQALAYGARTLIVRGNFDSCLKLAREAADKLGVYLVNSINPFRIEGQKTIALELLQQLDWNAPDWIVLPAGNLGNTAALGKALLEAKDAGLIDRIPRIAAVQAAGAAPFAASFARDFASHPTVEPKTVATAIRIGAPASWDRAVRVIRKTNGFVVAVEDDEILDAKAVVDRSGIGCEPASAASVAGIRALVQKGVIGASDRVVAILTGNVLKDPTTIADYHQTRDPAPRYANRPLQIEADLSAVERVLKPA